MACDEQLVERVRAVLKGTRGVGERRMFGGVCFTVNGNMVCGVVKDDLMVRVGPDRYERALKQPHARPMDFTGRPMKGFVFVAPQGIKSDASLKTWIGSGLEHVWNLAAKPKVAERR
jgi:TfoX/Sxy family transcriptional regulator of competence genes